MTLGPFFRDALTQLVAREWWLPALLFFVLAGGSQAMLVLAPPGGDGQPNPLFGLAVLVRLVGVIWISVALLRLANPGERRPWAADGAFLFYGVLSLLALAVTIVVAQLTAGFDGIYRVALVEGISIAVLAPLAPWFVAAAVTRPIAFSPLSWLRGFGRWLPHYLVLALLIGLPIVVAHGALSVAMLASAGLPAFWPLALADAVASTIVGLFTLALRVAAYRSVAQG
jgi:hypothetical protein